MLPSFSYHAPATVAEASAELRRLDAVAKVYAGGAELLLLMRLGLVRADHLVDIKRIPGLGELRADDGSVRIGATVTHQRVATDQLVRERLPALADAEAHVGNIRIRTQGTLGGNLCFADPHADPGTALLLYDTVVAIGSSAGSREVPLERFFEGLYEVDLEPDELLTHVRAAPLGRGWGEAFLRVERTYRPTLNVAVAVRLQHGAIADARIAIGCVGPKAMRLRSLEADLRGVPPAAAQRVVRDRRGDVQRELGPEEDLLGSVDYKMHLVTVLVARALGLAAERAARTVLA